MAEWAIITIEYRHVRFMGHFKKICGPQKHQNMWQKYAEIWYRIA